MWKFIFKKNTLSESSNKGMRATLICSTLAFIIIFSGCGTASKSSKLTGERLNSNQQKGSGEKLKNNDDKDSTKNIDTSNQNNAAIKTIYGKHAYGCKTQQEYDEVITKLKEALNNPSIAKVSSYVDRFDNGERYVNVDKNSQDYEGLRNVENTLIGFLHFTNQKHHHTILKGDSVVNYFINLETDKASSSSESAYDVIFNKKGNALSNEQLMSAVLDILGYNTQIEGSNNYAKCFLEIDGQWWKSGVWVCVSPKETIISKPTFEI